MIHDMHIERVNDDTIVATACLPGFTITHIDVNGSDCTKALIPGSCGRHWSVRITRDLNPSMYGTVVSIRYQLPSGEHRLTQVCIDIPNGVVEDVQRTVIMTP